MLQTFQNFDRIWEILGSRGFITKSNRFIKTLDNIDLKVLEKVSKVIEKKIISKKNIFVAGNGGSASVANHFLCDFNKGI